MEIDITHLLEEDMFPFAHSRMEGGDNAGPDTWNAALNGPRPLLNTPEEFQAFRDHVKGYGAWSQEEINGWDDNECQALFLQMIAGDVRECPAVLEDVSLFTGTDAADVVWFYDAESLACEGGPYASRTEAYHAASKDLHGVHSRRAESLDQVDWDEYQVRAEHGSISGNLFRTEDGRIFYTLSN